MPAGLFMPEFVAMHRREFLIGIAAAAAAGEAWGQARAMPVIGYLGPETPKLFASRLKAFHQGLSEEGYVEGRNVAIDYHWAEGDYGRLPALAAQLANRQPSLIVATGGAPMALAAMNATKGANIVFEMGGDPVQLGIVSSLARPGGAITGVSSLSVEVSRKRLELLREIFPRESSFAVFVNPTSPTANSQLTNLTAAAEVLGVRLHVLQVSAEQQFEPSFAAAVQLGAKGAVFTSDPYFAFRSDQLAALGLRYSLPAITQSRDFPLAGGLMSYGGDFMQSHRRTGVYAGRVLSGAKPSDLPVQLVTKVEMVINLKTAQAFGLPLSRLIIGSSDEIIE